MKLKHWPNKAEWKEIRNQFRNETKRQPCFLMDQQQFNKLLHKYKQLKPDFDHYKAIKYLRFIINESYKHKQLTKATAYYHVNGCDRQLKWLDAKLDDALLSCVERDIL